SHGTHVTNQHRVVYKARRQMLTTTARESSETSSTPDFERIFREHGPLVYRTAYAVLGNREDADDVLQTIFLRLLRRDFPPALGKNPAAYLYRAAVNLSLDIIKTRRRQPPHTSEPDRIAAPPQSAPFFDDEMHRQLYEALTHLSPQSAEILILRYV